MPPADKAIPPARINAIAAKSDARSIKTSGAVRSTAQPVSRRNQRMRISSPTRPGVTDIAKPPKK